MKTLSITCIDAYHYTPTIKSLKKTLETLGKIPDLDIKTVYWFSDVDFPDQIDYNVKWIKINRFKKYTDEYNYITLKLVPHIAVEDFNLIIHPDGMAINADAWDTEFLTYDYLGARWGDGLVGNGGFTLRSRKLYDALIDLNVMYHTSQFADDIKNHMQLGVNDSFGDRVVPEDNIICKIYRNTLEKNYGIKFPHGDIVEKFSIEHNMGSPWLGKSLGFHGKHGISKYYGIEL